MMIAMMFAALFAADPATQPTSPDSAEVQEKRAVKIPANCFKRRAEDAADNPGVFAVGGQPVVAEPLPEKEARALIAQGEKLDREIVAYLKQHTDVGDEIATAMFAGDVIVGMTEDQFKIYCPDIRRAGERGAQRMLTVVPWNPRPTTSKSTIIYEVTVSDGHVIAVERPRGEMPPALPKRKKR